MIYNVGLEGLATTVAGVGVIICSWARSHEWKLPEPVCLELGSNTFAQCRRKPLATAQQDKSLKFYQSW